MQGSVLYKYICAGRRILMLAAGKLCELGSWARHIIECDSRIMHRTVYFPRMLPNYQLGPYQVFFRFFIGNACTHAMICHMQFKRELIISIVTACMYIFGIFQCLLELLECYCFQWISTLT